MTDDIHAALSREDLLKLLDIYAKNWLAHDGCWFLTLEDAYDTATAIEMDRRAWQRFAPLEARRIKRAFDLPDDGGLPALERALSLRLYARVNRQEIEWVDQHTLVFRMVECRVHRARESKGLPTFHCRPVGEVEFSGFAEAIDPRIQTRNLRCPPDPVQGCYCEWEFTLKGGE